MIEQNWYEIGNEDRGVTKRFPEKTLHLRGFFV